MINKSYDTGNITAIGQLEIIITIVFNEYSYFRVIYLRLAHTNIFIFPNKSISFTPKRDVYKTAGCHRDRDLLSGTTLIAANSQIVFY